MKACKGYACGEPHDRISDFCSTPCEMWGPNIQPRRRWFMWKKLLNRKEGERHV